MPTLLALAQNAAISSAGDQVAGSLVETLMTLGGLVSYTEFWLWMTLVVLIIEIFTSGFFIGAFAVSTLVAALAAWLGLGRNMQLVVFAAASIAALIWVRPIFLRLLATGRTSREIGEELFIPPDGARMVRAPVGEKRVEPVLGRPVARITGSSDMKEAH